jgi:polygalacturonase
VSLLKRAIRWSRTGLATLGVVAVGVATTTTLAPVGTAFAANGGPVFNVRTACGATGNGTTNDHAAIETCVGKAAAASTSALAATVEFPTGTYLSANTIHLQSNVFFQLDSGATLLGAGSAGTGYDPPEPNPYLNSCPTAVDPCEDFGHAHFHDALIFGDHLSNIGFVGSAPGVGGTIDGGGFTTGTPSTGQADKNISLTNCTNLTLNDIRITRGGHFGILINGCDGVTSDRLDVEEASARDGWNVISTSNVTITNITDHGNDDALVFKSDWALGRTINSTNVSVDGANLSAGCCNALMFGSETCGDFTGFHFNNINITGAGKSGLGLVSSDGANISDIHYTNITMSGHINSLIMQKVWNRNRCGVTRGPGSVSNIEYSNITGTTTSDSFAPTLWGYDNASHDISNVTFNNVQLTTPGGATCTNPDTLPSNSFDYNPSSIGCRPAFGMFMHNVSGIGFTNNSSFKVSGSDGRPAFDDITGSNISIDHTTTSTSTSAADAHFNATSGYCVTSSTNASGAPLRVTTSNGATQHCGTTSPDFSLNVAPATQTVTAGSSATYTVSTAVVTGSPDPITLSANVPPPAGASVSFSPNPVAAGGSSTMTISTAASDPGETTAITVTGTDTAASHTAGTSLTVKPQGGGGNQFSLSVAPGTQTITQGQAATYTVSAAAVSGTPGPIALSVNVPPPTGATASFGSSSISAGGSTTLTITTAATSPTGSFAVTVTGTDPTSTPSTGTAGTTLIVNPSGGGLTLSNLVVNDTANAANWSLQTNLQVGDTIYGDRTYTVTALPAAITGAHWVRTANSSKASTANPLVTFSISQGATVYLGVDTRNGKRPWMDASWVDTHTVLTTNESGTTRTFEVFNKSFAAGTVALGPNAATNSMYTIAVA